MKVLVTGFEPFGGADLNPSWEAVRLLPDTIGGASVVRLQLPVVYGQAGEMAIQAAQDARADLLICTGVAGGRTAVTPELLAVNWRMASLADNAGKQYTGERIDRAAPDAVMTTLPVQPLIDSIRAADIPCYLSLSAGAYVCNDLYWHALRAQPDHGYKALFVHVPTLDHLPAVRTAAALEACIRAALQAITPTV